MRACVRECVRACVSVHVHLLYRYLAQVRVSYTMKGIEMSLNLKHTKSIHIGDPAKHVLLLHSAKLHSAKNNTAVCILISLSQADASQYRCCFPGVRCKESGGLLLQPRCWQVKWALQAVVRVSSASASLECRVEAVHGKMLHKTVMGRA